MCQQLFSGLAGAQLKFILNSVSTVIFVSISLNNIKQVGTCKAGILETDSLFLLVGVGWFN